MTTTNDRIECPRWPPLMVLTAFVWLALIPMALIWWSVATSRYLRMPHAWGIGLAVVIIGMLAPLALAEIVLF